jgi:signal peptidase II
MTDANGRPVWPVFLGLAAGIVAADQLSKAWLTSALAPNASVDVVGDLVRVTYSQNQGGLFGVLQGQALAFAGLSVVVVGLIVAYHARAGRDPWLSVALGLLLGGALGNLLDRLTRGFVVDWVDAGIGTWRWYTFNVADAAISCAIVLLVLLALRPGTDGTRAGDRSPSDQPAGTE